MQGLYAYSDIGVIDQRLQDGIAHAHILTDKTAQAVEGLQAHAGVGVILQRVHQYFADIIFVWRRREFLDGVHAHAGVEIVASREQQKLLDALVVERSLNVFGVHRVVLDVDLIGAGVLGDGTDAGNRSFQGRNIG